MQISETDLILNPDGSVYHLHLKPEHIGNQIIVVGDPDRVPLVSKYFDSIEFQIQKREFVTHTGFIGNKRLSVISSGIGTDNVDILINELYALANINLATREVKKEHNALDIIRLGTSGSIQKHIEIDSILISKAAIGIDSLNDFYHFGQTLSEKLLCENLQEYLGINSLPYHANASVDLLNKFSQINHSNAYIGHTLTCPGFYGPQGRTLNYKSKNSNLLKLISDFRFGEIFISNMEMETSGWYVLCEMLGFNCLSLNAILANRTINQFSQNPEKQIDTLIINALEILAQ
ncbi:MAG: nucleoside phosphorylase [Bacteroidota bacterium]